MTRYHFYTIQKVLIHDIIMYHLPVHPDQVRVAIATFAVDVTVTTDGISRGRSHLTKCDLFTPGGAWDAVLYKVQYVDTGSGFELNQTVTDGTFVDLAYEAAANILASGERRCSLHWGGSARLKFHTSGAAIARLVTQPANQVLQNLHVL